ncbi:MAG: hypothetical protein OXC60_14850 [Litoreibacter sp.]|nr:hypothetical protein [Litoreibacter sp.]
MIKLGKKDEKLQIGANVDPVDVEEAIPVVVVRSKIERFGDVFVLFSVTLFATIVGGCILSWLF